MQRHWDVANKCVRKVTSYLTILMHTPPECCSKMHYRPLIATCTRLCWEGSGSWGGRAAARAVREVLCSCPVRLAHPSVQQTAGRTPELIGTETLYPFLWRRPASLDFSGTLPFGLLPLLCCLPARSSHPTFWARSCALGVFTN